MKNTTDTVGLTSEFSQVHEEDILILRTLFMKIKEQADIFLAYSLDNDGKCYPARLAVLSGRKREARLNLDAGLEVRLKGFQPCVFLGSGPGLGEGSGVQNPGLGFFTGVPREGVHFVSGLG